MKYLAIVVTLLVGCIGTDDPLPEYFLFKEKHIVCVKGTDSKVLILEIDRRTYFTPYRVLFPQSGEIAWLNQSNLMECE